VAADASGSIYLGGSTSSSTLPMASNSLKGSNDGFFAKISMGAGRQNPPRLLRLRYVGGDSTDSVSALGVNQSGTVEGVSGTSQSTNMETPNGYQTTKRGSLDAYLIRFDFMVPVIDGIAPASGMVAGGDIVHILGRNLAGAIQVEFGDAVLPASTFQSASDTEIAVNSPAAGGPGTVKLRVTTPEGLSNFAQFTYLAQNGATETPALAVPNLTSITPPAGPAAGGTPVTISGSNLAGAIEVRFGPVVIPTKEFAVSGDAEIKLLAPAHVLAEAVPVSIKTAFRGSNSLTFTYTANTIVPPLGTGTRPGTKYVSVSASTTPGNRLPLPSGPAGPTSGGGPGAPAGSGPLSAQAPTAAASGAQPSVPVVLTSHDPLAAPGISGAPDDQPDPAFGTDHAMTRAEPMGLFAGAGLLLAACFVRGLALRRQEPGSEPGLANAPAPCRC